MTFNYTRQDKCTISVFNQGQGDLLCYKSNNINLFLVTLNMDGKSTKKAFDSQIIDLALLNETVISTLVNKSLFTGCLIRTCLFFRLDFRAALLITLCLIILGIKVLKIN